MSKTKLLNVLDKNIRVANYQGSEFICITDIANSKDGASKASDIIKNWIRTRTTLEFFGTWEQLFNPKFKVVEFDHFKMNAGLPSFVLSPSQWAEKTDAIGIYVKAGKYGGTYAHKDIAFEFCSAINPIFKLFLIKEFQRLKEEESKRDKLEWNLQRTISKINYKIHTDAIKENLIPLEITQKQSKMVYASEADVLNVALFGLTAQEWKTQNPSLKGNMRDYASLEQLVVLSNLESINSLLISQNLTQSERLIQMNKVAISQMNSLLNNSSMKDIK